IPWGAWPRAGFPRNAIRRLASHLSTFKKICTTLLLFARYLFNLLTIRPTGLDSDSECGVHPEHFHREGAFHEAIYSSSLLAVRACPVIPRAAARGAARSPQSAQRQPRGGAHPRHV